MQTTIPIKKEKLESLSTLMIQKKMQKHNENWMKDWIEQVDNFKNNPEALIMIENDLEGFLHYVDVMKVEFA
jgi:hypothetical protein